MEPRLRSSIPLRKARVHRNVPVALTASTRFQSSSDVLASGALCATPALLTRTSTLPCCAAAVARSMTLPGSVTSQCTAQAVPPAPRISVATRSIRSVRRAATTTAAPARANSAATTAPIPEPPPVTTARHPSNLGKHRLLQNRSERLDELRPLGGRRGGGIAEVGAWPAGVGKRALARLDGEGQGLGIGDQGLANVLPDGGCLLAHDN